MSKQSKARSFHINRQLDEQRRRNEEDVTKSGPVPVDIRPSVGLDGTGWRLVLVDITQVPLGDGMLGLVHVFEYEGMNGPAKGKRMEHTVTTDQGEITVRVRHASAPIPCGRVAPSPRLFVPR